MPKRKLSPEGEVIAAYGPLWSPRSKFSSTVWKSDALLPGLTPFASTWKW
jgi:hypothetical protein